MKKQNTEVRIQKSDHRNMNDIRDRSAVGRAFLSSVICLLSSVLLGCAGLKDAREIKNAPMPVKYVETKEVPVFSSEGSLWKDSSSLYEDRKAKRVNDLVTILINETSLASKKATTNANRNSSGDYGLDNVFGHSLRKSQLDDMLGTSFSPTVKGSAKSDFAGKGDTSRQGTLQGTITAKVIEVLPNSNMLIESRKEIVANNEKEILVLRGIVRPDDISPNNTVSSRLVADAQMYLVGDGVLDDKQAQGWLVRILDKVWPF